MAYCLNSDVQAQIKDITFTTTTKITLAEIDAVIVQSDAYIDARLNTIYTVPVSGVASLALLKLVSQNYSSAEVWRRFHPANLTAGETSLSTQWEKKASSILTDIIDGTIQLVDAIPLGIVARSNDQLLESGVNNLGESDAGYNPFFTVGDKF